MSHIAPVKSYVAVFGTLMVLTVITVAAAFTDLGNLNFPVALAVAVTKATVVILFFMHVKYSSKLTKLVVSGTLFFLLALFGLTLTDYLSRGWDASPRGSTTGGTLLSVTPPAASPTPEAAHEGAAH